jgi:hypothetical protein
MRIALLILLINLLLTANPAVAFGPDGHKIVAQLAQEGLTPQAKDLVAQLLKGDSANDLAGVAIWADSVKRESGYKWSRSMHYVNFPDTANRYQMQRDCPDKACVIEAINRFSRELGDVNTPLVKRREALKFLVHFIGDIHQPLHAGRKQDKGGNDIYVKWFGQTERLHWVWDSGLITRHNKNWKSHASELASKINQRQQIQWGKSTSAAKWALASSKLALSNAYNTPKNKKLDQGYYRTNLPVVQLQLQKAGVRLAAALNQIAQNLNQ